MLLLIFVEYHNFCLGLSIDNLFPQYHKLSQIGEKKMWIEILNRNMCIMKIFINQEMIGLVPGTFHNLKSGLGL
jgi:hypothetical protein